MSIRSTPTEQVLYKWQQVGRGGRRPLLKVATFFTKMISKINRAVIYAFEKGYRVRKDGTVVNPKGGVIKGRIGNTGYKKFSIRLNGKETSQVSIHKLCAYQKYGDIIFQAECVRHLDGNPLNNCPDNIEIGTQKDNMMDVPKDVRQKKAEYATSFMRKYNKNEVRDFYKQNGNSYKKTKEHFGITSNGTLWFILNK